MSDRVTMNSTSRLVLADIQTMASRLAQTQLRIASGRQILRPSDDPSGTTRALGIRTDLAANRQHQRNIGEARSWIDSTDSALATIGDSVLRARDLIVQGGNGSAPQSSRDAIAQEIDQIVASIKGSANTTYAGRYVFGGTATTAAPYSTANDTYGGDQNAISREIGSNVAVKVNVDGKAVIGDGTSGLIASLRQVAADLRAGNINALNTTDLQAIDTAHDTLLTARATIGAISGRLDAAESRLTQVEETAMTLLSSTEDADMAKTLIDYSTQQAAYQAALKAGANLIQPSLLDYLR